MKVLALILVVIAVVDAKGSGPYLYQRPEGPAFMLPSEVVKPIQPPATIANLNQGSEASGSDFLQEYGPPKVQDLSLNLISQGLPDVTIEQNFGPSAQNAGSLSQVTAEKVVEISEAKPEIPIYLQTTTSQSSLDDNPPISAELPILDFEVKETTREPFEVATTEVSQSNQQFSETQTEVANGQSNQIISQESINVQSNQQNSEVTQVTTASTNQELTQSLLQESEKTPVGITEVLLVNAVPSSEQKVPEAQNIPDIVASLDKEVLTLGAVSDLAPVASLGPVPEGFLEYGPPGFIEYGPPKGDEDKSEKLQTIVLNETRRRRFSPKLRLGRN